MNIFGDSRRVELTLGGGGISITSFDNGSFFDAGEYKFRVNTLSNPSIKDLVGYKFGIDLNYKFGIGLEF